MLCTELAPADRRGRLAPTHFRAAAERRAPHGARSASTQLPSHAANPGRHFRWRLGAEWEWRDSRQSETAPKEASVSSASSVGLRQRSCPPPGRV